MTFGTALVLSAAWAALLGAPSAVDPWQAWIIAGLLLVVVGGAGAAIVRRRSGPPEPEAQARTAETHALLERRAMRRGRVRLEEDPIVAAIGIGDEATARSKKRSD